MADTGLELNRIREIGRAAAALSKSESVMVALAAARIHAIALDLLIEIAPNDTEGSWQVLA